VNGIPGELRCLSVSDFERHFLGIFVEIFSAGLSKLHSTCAQDFFWGNKNFFWRLFIFLFGRSAKFLRTFAKSSSPGLSKLHFTRPKYHF